MATPSRRRRRRVVREEWHCEMCTLINTWRDRDPPDEEEFNDDLNTNGARQYLDYDDDFENPYASFPDPVLEDEYRSRRETSFRDVEEISDHEPPQPYNSQPRYSRRPALRAFEHFVCVEDLDGDPSCKIDYRSMFADSGRGKSYADRFAKRRRESQKRKRSQAEAGNSAASGGGRSTGGKRAKKTERRASTGRAASTAAASKRGAKAKAKRGSSGTGRVASSGAASRRASAPPSFYSASTVNHYDPSSADIGDDVSTMAWEGVGSAGYF
ncbi:hypothetical protein ATCC90586_009421 [Pythium insidiosum]|nr:hypothetical protein ATCC90586_009421 [Pythium insidiosum]